ncbi:hypothetical protein GWK47_029952 [Chionoecetes opilio]|uniref:Uncharacterized protein n=1 Tax=Chionoecetes opilio TaxID=41210 RepID=A0A8J4YS37_CHIOP|nr:hypothetical protein GWK47_029952 [Chionoecetes opilio]
MFLKWILCLPLLLARSDIFDGCSPVDVKHNINAPLLAPSWTNGLSAVPASCEKVLSFPFSFWNKAHPINGSRGLGDHLCRRNILSNSLDRAAFVVLRRDPSPLAKAHGQRPQGMSQDITHLSFRFSATRDHLANRFLSAFKIASLAWLVSVVSF